MSKAQKTKKAAAVSKKVLKEKSKGTSDLTPGMKSLISALKLTVAQKKNGTWRPNIAKW